MSIRFDAAADRLLRTASVPNYLTTAYTALLWFYFASRPSSGAYGTLFCLNDSSAGDYIDVYGQGAADTRLRLVSSDGSTYDELNGATNLSPATWYCAAIVQPSGASSTLLAYLAAVGSRLASHITLTRTFASRGAPNRMEMGAWAAGNNDPYNGRVAAVKIWTAALTLAELQMEQFTFTPRRWANLYSYTPLLGGTALRAKDFGGNDYGWTVGGTLTEEDNPPLSWGANALPAGYLAAAAPPSAAFQPAWAMGSNVLLGGL